MRVITLQESLRPSIATYAKYDAGDATSSSMLDHFSVCQWLRPSFANVVFSAPFSSFVDGEDQDQFRASEDWRSVTKMEDKKAVFLLF